MQYTRANSRNDGKVKCIYCYDTLQQGKAAINCDICKNWVCLTCSKISKTLYTELSKQEKELEWRCRICKTTLHDLQSIGAALTELKE